MKTLKKLHNKISRKYPQYRKWHKHKYHSTIHLFVFLLISVFTTIMVVDMMRSEDYGFARVEAAKESLQAGKFWFPYPVFGTAGGMSTTTFSLYFDTAYTHPKGWDNWSKIGNDLREFSNSPQLKHLNVRTIEYYDKNRPQDNIGDHPEYHYVADRDARVASADKWRLYDQDGKTISLFGWGEVVDFADPEYLDWTMKTWMVDEFFDPIEKGNKEAFYVHDNGNFRAITSTSTCMGSKSSIVDQATYNTCMRYDTDDEVRDSWKKMLLAFKSAHPNKKILISSGPVTYETPSDQMRVWKEVYQYADGYWSESFTNNQVYWETEKNGESIRNAMNAIMQLSDWLALNNKYMFVNVGMAGGLDPQNPKDVVTNTEIDYAWAFFNVLRKGDKQYFSYVTRDPVTGAWVPRIYPEMTKSLGNPLGDRREIRSDVYRREYENALAYVNLSDSSISIDLPQGFEYTNARNERITSPLVLNRFSGLTVYKIQTRAPQDVPNPVVNSAPILVTNMAPNSPVSTAREVKITFNTDRNATCRFSRTPNIVYDSMWSLSLTEGRNHELKVDNPVAGTNKYYFKCKDNSGFVSPVDHMTILTVFAPTGRVKVTANRTVYEGGSYNLFRFTDWNWNDYGGEGTFRMYLRNAHPSVQNIIGLGFAYTNISASGYIPAIRIDENVVGAWLANAPQVAEDDIRKNFYVEIQAWKDGKMVASGKSPNFSILRR